jgi:hypothetical protein
MDRFRSTIPSEESSRGKIPAYALEGRRANGGFQAWYEAPISSVP